ncbi:piggyBac transposable element-derived protein 4-like [Macrosteles quadrilineatus]|uniref:piggyBac transposable element-derived protein 4-like n=1 Tax=Macrosteles quadrilineatus TaxID=74068 RepID=UPI0023E1C0C2|nr:piggyBac transposable element-derived protein 4-like [Macrosteles quadrilineatus]
MAYNVNSTSFSGDIIELLNKSFSEGDVAVDGMELDEDDNISVRSCDVNNANIDGNDIDIVNGFVSENDKDADVPQDECNVVQVESISDEQVSEDDIGNASSFIDSEKESLHSSTNESTMASKKSFAKNSKKPSKKRSTEAQQPNLTKAKLLRMKWDKEYDFVTDSDSGPVSTIPIYNCNYGRNLPTEFDLTSKPIDFFSLYFHSNLIQLICDETNLYAQSLPIQNQRKQKVWADTTTTEIRALLGVVLNMGLHPLPDIKDYFSLSWVNKMPFFSDVFTRDRFLMLFWRLHFSHEQGSARDLKIRNIVNTIQEQCKLFYTPSSYVSVDESTISFKGKISFRVYNPDKPVKFGLKVFVLSDALNGYIYSFSPYYGKSDGNEDELLKTTNTVLQLCDSLVKDPLDPPSGHHVYVDRYYNSPELAKELLKKNMFVTGTVMNNRKEMPTLSKPLNCGDVEARRNKDLGVIYWKDKRVVTMLTTKHKISRNEMTEKPSKWPNKPPVLKPDVVLDYTKHMGGVDRADHVISSYQFMRRTKKWYRKLFFWLLEVSTINSYILYKSLQEDNNRVAMSHKQFRLSLVEDLVRDYVQETCNFTRRRPGRPKNDIQRLNGKLHVMGKSPKGSFRCHVCAKNKVRKETVYFCKTCDEKPYLHPDTCFEVYHTQKDYF